MGCGEPDRWVEVCMTGFLEGELLEKNPGQASKAQVQMMIEHLLGLKITNEHAAAALAVSVCHFFHSRWPR